MIFTTTWYGAWIRLRFLLILLFTYPVHAEQTPPFQSGLLSFAADFHGYKNQHEILLIPVLPGELVELYVEAPSPAATFRVEVPHGEAVKSGLVRWQWQVPAKKGLYSVNLIRMDTEERMQFQVVVQVPSHQMKKGVLNGYRIGKYPKPRLGEPLDAPPRGFIEVTPENENTPVSPHFVLKQFLCKQSGGYPKYVLLDPRLLTKLEVLLQDVNARGIPAETFHVMSAYRTPFYNAAIKNVAYSRHVWGSAADIFIDTSPRDGDMDDLNRDGIVSRADAAWLYKLADSFHQRHPHLGLEGGVGEYDRTAAHGPFVHVDVRGTAARWGHKP